MTKAVISIVNYKQKDLLERCLKQLFSLSVPSDWQIIVVDNNSQDGCRELINTKYPQVKFIQSDKNLGFGGGHNLAYQNSDSDYFIVLNPDVLVLPQSIETLINELEKNPNAAIAGPCLLNPDYTVQKSARRYYDWKTVIYRRLPLPSRQKVIDYHLMQDCFFDKTTDVPWLVGAALAIKRKAFLKNTLFDTRYKLYFEDVDLCYFVKLKGWQVLYCPNIKMLHNHQRASKRIFTSAFTIHFSSWLKFYIKAKRYRQKAATHRLTDTFNELRKQ